MKIAIVVQGRFHAFDLAQALVARGHAVTVFTNYPKWAIKRFGLSTERVRSFWFHGILSRLGSWIHGRVRQFEPERWLHPMFGQWVASQLVKETWDVVHGWSGVSEEHLQRANNASAVKLIMRGSAHIRVQSRLLEQEEERAKCQIDRPGPWITAREEREYALTDRVVVLSTFAYNSFVAEGFDRAKLALLPLGTNTTMFRPTPEVVETRCRRIEAGEPLRVLYVGTPSLRKGLLDVAATIRKLKGGNFNWRFVGPVGAEAKAIKAELSTVAEFIPKQRQSELPKWYEWGDVFILPTIEDGFAVVLAQAQAAGLPILATTNCSAPDLIQEGETGWVLPIRRPDAFINRLIWCDAHRKELAKMVRRSYTHFLPRDWDDVAADFESLVNVALPARCSQPVGAHGR